MPKTFIKIIKCPEIASGGVWDVTYRNIELSQSTLKENMPILSVGVRNGSASDISIITQGLPEDAFEVAAGGTRSLSGVPVTQLRVKNDGIGTIAADEISINLINDIEQCKLYDEAVKKGYVYNYQRY
jgi:hypothetical protein